MQRRCISLLMTIFLSLAVCACSVRSGPTAGFNANPASGVAPLTVHFTDQSDAVSSAIVQWNWEFGDGGTAAEANPTHVYNVAGVYAVTLNVTTADGSESRSEPYLITVTDGSVGVTVGGDLGPLIEIPTSLAGDNPAYSAAAVPVPTPGASVTDPQFGTTATRVVATERLRHEYSRHDPFNNNQALIVLFYFPDGEWRVYKTDSLPYDQAGNLVTTLDFEEPRWDPDNPLIIWGMRDFSVIRYDLSKNESTVVKDFTMDATIGPIVKANPDLYRITMRDEGETSSDKRYWAFILQGTKQDYRPRYIFTWDKATDRVPGVYMLAENQSDIDWVGMSPNGTWVLIGGFDHNAAPVNGLVIANKELTQFHRLDNNTAHADVGLDGNGNEVIVMQNVHTDYIDMLPLVTDTSPVTDSDGSYDGTNRLPLLRLFYDSSSSGGFSSGVHISCNYPGYCVISTYTEPRIPARNWLDRKIIIVKLDPADPRAYYLFQVRGTTGAYWEETQASITNDGSRVVWATNWNQQVGEERVWLMELRIPWK